MKKWSQGHLLQLLIVEYGTVAEVGRPFCLATYAAKGDDPLIFGIYKTFEQLEAFVKRSLTFPQDSTTQQRCKEAALLIEPNFTQLKINVVDAKDNVIN